MKLLKSYLCLRSTMTVDRLTGLVLMYIHLQVEIDVREIIRRFTAMPAKSRPARQAPSSIADIDIDVTDTATTEAVAPAVKRRRTPIVRYVND